MPTLPSVGFRGWGVYPIALVIHIATVDHFVSTAHFTLSISERPHPCRSISSLNLTMWCCIISSFHIKNNWSFPQYHNKARMMSFHLSQSFAKLWEPFRQTNQRWISSQASVHTWWKMIQPASKACLKRWVRTWCNIWRSRTCTVHNEDRVRVCVCFWGLVVGASTASWRACKACKG